MGGQGTIAIAVFVGGDAAWRMGIRHWESRREQADGVFLTNATTTFDGSGQEVPVALEGLHARARAQTLSPQVHELVLVVQTDEFLHLGLPLESVGAVVEVDRDLAAYHDRTQPVTDERKQALCSLLRAWESKAR
jgi:cyanophycin synthetase